MTDASNEGGAPLAVISDRDRQQFVQATRAPVSPARIVSGGLAGGAALAFGGTSAWVIGSVVVPWRGFSFAGPSFIVGAMLLTIAGSLARLAWRWTHSLPPLDDDRTPQQRQLERDAFNAERRR